MKFRQLSKAKTFLLASIHFVAMDGILGLNKELESLEKEHFDDVEEYGEPYTKSMGYVAKVIRIECVRISILIRMKISSLTNPN